MAAKSKASSSTVLSAIASAGSCSNITSKKGWCPCWEFDMDALILIGRYIMFTVFTFGGIFLVALLYNCDIFSEKYEKQVVRYPYALFSVELIAPLALTVLVLNVSTALYLVYDAFSGFSCYC
jgi:hypothetical protein